eukprot:6206138-Pleurochrysis_carterae.AAC.4
MQERLHILHTQRRWRKRPEKCHRARARYCRASARRATTGRPEKIFAKLAMLIFFRIFEQCCKLKVVNHPNQSELRRFASTAQTATGARGHGSHLEPGLELGRLQARDRHRLHLHVLWPRKAARARDCASAHGALANLVSRAQPALGDAHARAACGVGDECRQLRARVVPVRRSKLQRRLAEGVALRVGVGVRVDCAVSRARDQTNATQGRRAFERREVILPATEVERVRDRGSGALQTSQGQKHCQLERGGDKKRKSNKADSRWRSRFEDSRA